MKVVKTKLIQKAKGRQLGKYHLTLEVNDNDLNMMEDIATTMAPFEILLEPNSSNDWNGIYSPDFKPKYQKWLIKLWRCFWKPWDKYDDSY